ncbi:hypothetical protein PG984_010465 [Apiospora sp. TS-2023a]
MDSTSYPYAPLRGDEIRYLTLHALDESVGVVKCSLRHASLHDLEGQYTALSYAWGDASVTETIHVMGHPFNVTTNLADCLRQLATTPKYQEISLWVDAICINQRDTDERNTQVRRMGDIYSLAESVTAWLGLGTRLSNIAIQRLQNLKPLEINKFGDSEEMGKEERRDEVFNDFFKTEIEEGLRDLLSRPYWSRTWVVQEIRMGRQAHLVCGNDEVTVERMSDLIRHLSTSLYDVTASPNHSSEAFGLLNHSVETGAYAILLSGPVAQSVALYLHKFRGQRCSDPRDKVYGLLGIFAGLGAEIVVPDYDRPVAKVYGDVIEAHIKSHDDLDFLRFTGHRDKSDPDVPSWIPDWPILGHWIGRQRNFTLLVFASTP